MKYRKGFVTNSSSSSYVCEICGEVEAGYDMGLSEADMYECENGHTFCKYHVDKDDIDYYINSLKYILHNKINVTDEQRLRMVTLLANPQEKDLQAMKSLADEITNVSYEEEYDFPAPLCPICNKTFIKDSAVLSYVANKFDFKVADIEEEIRQNTYK